MNIGISSLLGTAVGAFALAGAVPAGADSGISPAAAATASACRAQTLAVAPGLPPCALAANPMHVGIVSLNSQRRASAQSGARNVPGSGPGNAAGPKYRDVGGYY